MEKGRKWAYRWVLQNEPTVGGRCIYLSCSFSGMIPIKRKGFLCVCLYHEAHMCIWCVCVCVVKTFLCFFVVGIFKSFLDYTEILKTFLDKNTSVGFLAIMEFMIFLYMYAFPSRFIYALAFSSDSCWRPVLLRRIRASFEQMYKYTHHPWPAFQ